MAGGVHRMEFNVEVQSFAEEVQHALEHGAEVFRRMDVQRGCASQQPEGGNQADKSEAMVAVQVGDEHMVEMGELEVGTAHLQLRAFATVNHVEFFAHVEHLRGGEMPRGGKRRTATQYCQFEFFHVSPFSVVTKIHKKER